MKSIDFKNAHNIWKKIMKYLNRFLLNLRFIFVFNI